MIKRFIALFSILIALTASAGVGDWVLYPSYHNATYCQKAGDRIYVLASGALYSYNTSDDEVRTYDKINTLSDIDITHIAYCKDIKALVIVYSNANIDILYDDDEVYNMSDFKKKTLPSKKINGINIQGTTAYLSTSFGIVEIDLEEYEFTNTYTLDKEVYCACTFDNRIYASTPDGIISGDRNNNLLDRKNWQNVNSHIATAMDIHAGRIYYLVKNSGLFYLDNRNSNGTRMLHNGELLYLYSNGNELLSGSHKVLYTIDSNHNPKSYTLDGKENN